MPKKLETLPQIQIKYRVMPELKARLLRSMVQWISLPF